MSAQAAGESAEEQESQLRAVEEFSGGGGGGGREGLQQVVEVADAQLAWPVVMGLL